ncbi:hypothetical protein M422DRAFT_45859 [Sphaerobolus stellatus SS14]|nr:hypothetical protein M422DRAFT_45859 [Sphaerobolus stellatus SS14]
MFLIFTIFISSSLLSTVVAVPMININGTNFYGYTNKTKYGAVDKFFSIPYTLSPIRDRRFRLPFSIIYAEKSTYNASRSGPRYSTSIRRLLVSHLFYPHGRLPKDYSRALDIVAPGNITSDAKFSVVVWLTGGAFEPYGPLFSDKGKHIVDRSLALGKPIIYVTINYRTSVFGFLGGKEVKAAKVGNIGLHDRIRTRRIKRSVHALRSTDSNRDINQGQAYYDKLVLEVGCRLTLNTLNCLRRVDSQLLRRSMMASPALFSYKPLDHPWNPAVDGVLFKEDPYTLVEKGAIADVPIVIGSCDDEGTDSMFTLPSLNITNRNDDELKAYIQTIFSSISSDEVQHVMEEYPEDPAKGHFD